MDEFESLSHTTWDCKYHVVFIRKRRRKTLYAEPRRHLAEVFRRLAMQKECRIEEGHLLPDHVYMMIAALRLLTGYVDLLLQGQASTSSELQRSAATHVHDLVALAVGAARDAAHVASGRGALCGDPRRYSRQPVAGAPVAQDDRALA
jgi:hypothetical protein